MKDLKASYPVELASYVHNNNIQNEPAFSWWTTYVLKKKNIILSKVKSKYWERSHKFGIRIPKSIREAIEIDKENGDSMWTDAIAEEMNKVRIAFELYEDSITSLIGYKQLHIHMIFDIRMGENFRRKARLVADGHRTIVPASSTYSTVVSRDSVRICLLFNSSP